MPRTAKLASAFVPRAEQAVGHEAVEVVGGEVAAHTDRAAGLVPADPATSIDHEVVERTTHRIREASHGSHPAVEALVAHGASVKQNTVDIYPLLI